MASMLLLGSAKSAAHAEDAGVDILARSTLQSHGKVSHA